MSGAGMSGRSLGSDRRERGAGGRGVGDETRLRE